MNEANDPGEPLESHPEAIYSPEVFAAMHEVLVEAKGSPMHALRLAISRQVTSRPSEDEAEAIVAAVDAIRNPFAQSTRQDELLVFDAALRTAGHTS